MRVGVIDATVLRKWRWGEAARSLRRPLQEDQFELHPRLHGPQGNRSNGKQALHEGLARIRFRGGSESVSWNLTVIGFSPSSLRPHFLNKNQCLSYRYCIGVTARNQSDKALGLESIAIVCFEDLGTQSSIETGGILTLISVFFLAATFAVYMYLPQMRFVWNSDVPFCLLLLMVNILNYIAKTSAGMLMYMLISKSGSLTSSRLWCI